MSIIDTFSNRDQISSHMLKMYAVSMISANLSWIWAWILLARPEGQGYFRHIEENRRVIVEDDGRVLDNRAVDNQTIEKINCILYQPYYKLRNKSWSIWLVEYEIDEAISVLPVWHHTFHKEWISEWLIRNSTCPFWRRHISRSDVENEKEENYENILKMVKKNTLDKDAENMFAG